MLHQSVEINQIANDIFHIHQFIKHLLKCYTTNKIPANYKNPLLNSWPLILISNNVLHNTLTYCKEHDEGSNAHVVFPTLSRQSHGA